MWQFIKRLVGFGKTAMNVTTQGLACASSMFESFNVKLDEYNDTRLFKGSLDEAITSLINRERDIYFLDGQYYAAIAKKYKNGNNKNKIIKIKPDSFIYDHCHDGRNYAVKLGSLFDGTTSLSVSQQTSEQYLKIHSRINSY